MVSGTVAGPVVPEVIGVDPLLKVNQAAGLLALGKSKVYELMDAGRLRNVRIDGSRRIPRSAVVEFLQGLQDGAGEAE